MLSNRVVNCFPRGGSKNDRSECGLDVRPNLQFGKTLTCRREISSEFQKRVSIASIRDLRRKFGLRVSSSRVDYLDKSPRHFFNWRNSTRDNSEFHLLWAFKTDSKLIAACRRLKQPRAKQLLNFWCWTASDSQRFAHQPLHCPVENRPNLFHFPEYQVERCSSG